MVAVGAIIISLVAIASAIILKPTPTIGTGDVGTNELADGSVTGEKIADGAITDADIVAGGISRIADGAVGSDQIADGAVTLQKLAESLVDMITGVENIADNSITSAKIRDGTITNADISPDANIDPGKISGTAWTSTNDGTGSGLDADTLDGLEGSQFLRNDTSGIISGDLTVNGSITHRAENRYYTIPFCAFVGSQHDTEYSFDPSAGLQNIDPAFSPQYYWAPVNLPDGATITKLIICYRMPDIAADLRVSLENGRSGAYSEVISIDLSAAADWVIYEEPITETVRANNNGYWVRVLLEPNDDFSDVQLYFVSIAYTVTRPLP